MLFLSFRVSFLLSFCDRVTSCPTRFLFPVTAVMSDAESDSHPDSAGLDSDSVCVSLSTGPGSAKSCSGLGRFSTMRPFLSKVMWDQSLQCGFHFQLAWDQPQTDH